MKDLNIALFFVSPTDSQSSNENANRRRRFGRNQNPRNPTHSSKKCPDMHLINFINLFHLFSSKRKLCKQCTDRHGRYECQY